METSKLALLDPNRIPRHIAIIMDGNGRWAQQHKRERTYGHIYGVEAVRNVLKAAVKAGVKVLTLYTFSEENWNRPQEEVEALMELLVNSIHNEIDELKANNVSLQAIGDLSKLPNGARETLAKAIQETAHLTSCQLVLAINYSGRTEILRAAEQISKKGITEVDEETFSKELYLPSLPNPDLLIRTGGELRISNFLLWQVAYAELYFTPTYWPDFGAEDLYEAILEYQGRERRFGKTSEQINNDTND